MEEQNIKNTIERLKPKEAPKTMEPREKEPVDLEKAPESLGERAEGEQKQVSEQISSMAREDAAAPAAPVLTREQREEQIENFLAHGLEDVFLNMSAKEQRTFKASGEKTVKEISSLLDKTKLRAKKIVDLIKKWLSFIPGVSEFFLEQEAKIRADKIIKLRR